VSLRSSLLPRGTPPAAFRRLVGCEARLAWRTPSGIVVGFGLPLLLLVVFGSIPKFRHPDPALGGHTFFGVYVPVLVVLSVTALALWGLPQPLAAYREQGVLRRLSITPVPPTWVLAAQVVVDACCVALAVVVILVAAVLLFDVRLSPDPLGLVLSLVLCTAALFALGLLIGAVARSAAMAGALTGAAFFPLMFFAGLWVPREVMPTVLREVSDYTPLGAAVEAVQSSLSGVFPPAACLLVLAAWAAVFGYLAVRFFRWE